MAMARLALVVVFVALLCDPVLALPKAPAKSDVELPEGTASFLQGDPFQIIIPKSGKLTGTLLATAFALSVVFVYAVQSMFATWMIPPFGADTSQQTSVNVVSNWLGITSVVMTIALTAIVKTYNVYQTLRMSGRFHEPFKSAGTLDEGLDMMAQFATENSIDTFIEGEKDKFYYLTREFDLESAMTFEEWDNALRDQDKPDPVRVLIKFYYVDSKAQAALAKKGHHFEKDDVNKLLHEAYQWRLLNWQVAHLSNKLATSFDNTQRKELKTERSAVLVKANELREKLIKALQPAWLNMERHVEETSQYEETSKTLDNTENWGGTLLAAGLLLGNLYSFLDKSPECPVLVNKDLSIKQHLTRLNGRSTAPLPTIHHARTWMCSHLPTIFVEEGAACSLECNSGFQAEFGNTLCDSLGGGGMAWTHLNSGLLDHFQLDMPSCCIKDSTASTFETFAVEKQGTDLLQFRWNSTVGFHHACGLEQYVHMQACAYDPAKVVGVGGVDDLCNEYCTELDAATDNCVSKQKADLVPVQTWKNFEDDTDGVRSGLLAGGYGELMSTGVAEYKAGAEIGDLTLAVPTGWQLRVRLVSTNLNGVVKGPWHEVA